MTPEEHAVKIRECASKIMRLLAAQNFTEIPDVLDEICDRTYDIQTGK